MSDIVKRLRDTGSPLNQEAADEIERLEKIIEHLFGHQDIVLNEKGETDGSR